MTELNIKCRITSTLLDALPDQIVEFNAHLYVIVKRKQESFGPTKSEQSVKLDPCILDWESKTISIRIPFDINPNITCMNDLPPDFFDVVQAAFLTLAYACV